MIKVKNLKKSYGEVDAINGVSFEIGSGEIVGLLGPNGAGKTTIMKILTGYLEPDEGTVSIDNLDVMVHLQEVKGRIGYLPENAPLYPELSVQTYLKMIAEMRQVPVEEQTERISEAVYSVSLDDYLTRPIGQLSKGLRQRVGLAQAILHKPPMLILDEPTIGLDPTQVVVIRRLIKRLARRSTILFSTHILPEVEALCDRAIILMNGEIKADARLSELANTTNSILVLQNETPGAEKDLKALKGVDHVESYKTREGYPAFRIVGLVADVSKMVFHLACEKEWPLRELKYDVRTLESVFNELAVAAE